MPRSAVSGLAARVRDQERTRHEAALRDAVRVLDGRRYFALLDALDDLAAQGHYKVPVIA